MKLELNQYKMAHAMSVVRLPSRIDDHARLNPSSTARSSARPARSSSFIRSKIKTFASTAIPTDRINPAKPDNVMVTGSDLKIASTNTPYTASATTESTPGNR